MFGPESHGIKLAANEFDHGQFDECWRFELIDGLLVVSDFPPLPVADMNEELGCWLRNYRDNRPAGTVLDATLPGRMVKFGNNRRIIDRAVWAGLGRLPQRCEVPGVIVDFVYQIKDDRNYEARHDEFRMLNVQEYWIIDRLERMMTAHILDGAKYCKKLITESQSYRTKLLPGFELPLGRLLELADRWAEKAPEDEA